MAAVGEYLVEEILLTLPPKTLMRFKCASKGWYALINNPRFVAKHLSIFNSNSKHLLVMKKGLVLKDIKNTSNDSEKEDKEEELVFSLLNLCNNDDGIETGEDGIIVSSVANIKIPLSMSLLTRDEAVHMVAHCNGIICLLLSKKFQANLSPLPYFPLSPSIADREWHSYSIWVIPPFDVSLRIKKVMEGLRTEFGGPDNEPHIPIVVSIRMTYENVLDKFRSLCSENLHSFQAKINLLGTKDFYYQCISLLIDISTEAFSQFRYTIAICNEHFGFYWYSAGRRPHLSLLYGNLTEEERKVALEKVSILDESISSLSFTISQLALYKINYRDTTLKSWEKIAEYNLP